MKYQLKKELIETIEIFSKWKIEKLTLDGSELTEKLKYYLSSFMEGILDPDIDSSRPEGFIKNLEGGRLGDFSTRYIIIAYDNDMPIGLLLGLQDKPQRLHIYSMGVLPSYRKTGVASSLLTKCINDMIGNNFNEVILDVHSNNEPAYKLYKKFGFQ